MRPLAPEGGRRLAWELRHFLRHELALVGFAMFALALLSVRGAVTKPVALALSGSAVAFVVAVFALGKSGGAIAPRLRLTAAYLFALVLYQSVRFVVPLTGVPLVDGALLALDTSIFGSPPAGWFAPQAWLTELLSAAYLSYQAWLHLALLHALFRPVEEATRLADRVFTAMALGFTGYLLVPAVGPAKAFPELAAGFEGGFFTSANAWVVREGSAVFDVFPSLHVAIPALLLAHDARHFPRRFRLLLPVFALLVVSTLYLRYHYVVDLAAGAALAFIVARMTPARPPPAVR